jgi:predicted O-methyltransferase YrrM
MMYDAMPKDKQEDVKKILTGSNPAKDPTVTRTFLNTMLQTRAIFSPAGEYRRLHAQTKLPEHIELRKALEQTKAKHTLEVGFAYGTSALVFAEHHQKQKNTGVCHTILDPNQYGTGEGHWEGIGMENMKRIGFESHIKLVEESSVFALPDLAKTVKLDVALIDGLHLFDYTLIDIFYCLHMLRVGGILLVDDKRMKAITAVSKYVTRAYKHVVDLSKGLGTMLIIKKIAEDTRDWNTDETVFYDLRQEFHKKGDRKTRKASKKIAK